MKSDADPPSALEIALTCLLATLEERQPGVADDWVQRLESEAFRSEVHRLHGKKMNPALAQNLREAADMGARARYIAKAHAKPPAANLKRGKGGR